MSDMRNIYDAMQLATAIENCQRAKRELANALVPEATYQNRPVKDLLKEHPLTKLLDAKVAELRQELVQLI